MKLLDPTSSARHQTAETLEGFFVAVEDSRGPFVHSGSVSRGEEEGGQWAAKDDLYPFAHG